MKQAMTPRRTNHSPMNTFTICHLCGKTIQYNLLQSHLRTEHGLTYIEYREKLECQKMQSSQENEKKTK